MRHTRTVTVEPHDAGQRVDKFLAAKLPELSRARLQALLGAGAVQCDGALIAEAASRVKPGQRFVVSVPEPTPAKPRPEAIPLDVLFEDEHLLVLNKPAGLVVHPAPGHPNGTLVNAVLGHCADSLSGIGGVQRPGIVHRLDKDVSGVMVVAKHDRAHVRLAGQFSVHRIERAYEAVVWGLPAELSGSIDRPIGRHPKERKRMAVVAGGKAALTHYRLIEAAGTIGSRLHLKLDTGRTHQIRVHLGVIGLGIIGDRIYRPRRRPRLGPEFERMVKQFDRIALHARRLGFEHPITGEQKCFERPPPEAFGDLFEQMQMEANALISR